MLTHVDLDIRYETAVDSLPPDAQAFLRDTLGNKCGVLNGWAWHTVAETRDARSTRCIAFCTNGCPPMDCMFVWTYCPERASYELYFSPYDVVPTLGAQPLETGRVFADVMAYVAAHTFRSTYARCCQDDENL